MDLSTIAAKVDCLISELHISHSVSEIPAILVHNSVNPMVI